MPDVRARLIIEALDQTRAGMQSAAVNTGAVTSATKEAGFSMTDLYSTVRLVEMGIKAVEGVYNSIISPTIDLANETRKLQFNIGATAEDAGKLIYAADATGVSFGTLNTGLKAAIRTMQSHKSEGIEPNIAGLAQLADKYNAIQDPIQRTAFLMHNFGRSGADLAPLMALGGAGIKALGEEAVATGAILDQKGVDSMHHLEMATKELNASILGIKVSLAEEWAPTITKVIKSNSEYIEMQNMMTKAVQAGAVTQQDATAVQAAYQGGLESASDAVKYFQAAIDKVTPAIQNANQAETELTLTELDHSKAMTIAGNDMEGYSTNVKTHAEGLRGLKGVIDEVAYAEQKATAAFAAASEQGIVTAALSGLMAKNEGQYTAAIEKSNPEIKKLTDEIAKYTAEQGKAFTATSKSTVTQADYQIAIERAALAQQKYAEYHGKSATALEGLRIAAESAQNTLDKMTGKLGITTTGFIDNSSAIAKDQAALDILTQAQKDAEAQLRLTTGQFIYQQLILDTKLSPALELKMAHALGIVDDKSYALALRVQGLTQTYEDNLKSGMGETAASDLLAKSLAGVEKATVDVTMAGPPLDATLESNNIKMHDMITTADGVATAFDGATGAAGAYAIVLNNIPSSVTTDVTTVYHNVGTPPNSGGNYASGANFIVPPGFPNDSFPMRVQSGEHVQVTPAGQTSSAGGGSNALLQSLLLNLPSMISRAVRDGMQR